MSTLIKLKRNGTNTPLSQRTIDITGLVPSAGEPIFDKVGGRLYIGDGTSTIATLSTNRKYFPAESSMLVKTANIDQLAVTTEKLQNSTSTTTGVTTAKIADNAVKTAKIADSAVTLPKLAVDYAKYNLSASSSIETYIKRVAGDGVIADYAVKLTTGDGDPVNVGNATDTPVYFNGGLPKVCGKYGGGSLVKINGTEKQSAIATIYAPTDAPTASNQVVRTNSSKTPKWVSQSDLSVGSATTATKLSQAREIRFNFLNSNYGGAVNFDGSQNVSFTFGSATIPGGVIGGLVPEANRAVELKIGSYYYTASLSNGVLSFTKQVN